MKQATCHQDLPHKAKGLCGACAAVAWRAANKEKVTLQRRAWYAANKELKAGTNRVWRAAHPDYDCAWYAANKEKKILQSLAWYAANKGKVAVQQRAYNLANRERRAATRRAWCAANPERPLAYNRLRRARRLGANGSITPDQWASIKAAYAGRCAYCGKESAALTQDHVIPLSLGGSHTPVNIVPACRSCNSGKGARSPARLPAKRLLL